ncbi:thymopoietin isoform X3 [Spea bombifrons]|uniref:thymopoietin isoform X3 n=1 Tax=Spea bombifrons TaxID=233779 RepID=UPI00234B23CC|nr:thymopoietin isoform X3 [Spea bombifrons]
MPEFLEDPSVLTKDKLKTELVANNVSLPSGEQRKDVYVQLYLKHLTSRNRGTPDFSSDEEREATPIRGRGRPSGRKATKKTDKPRSEEKDEMDVTELSNEALKEELIKYGMKPGPIVGNTRRVYEQRLLKLKEQGSILPPAPLAVDSSSADNNQNGNTDSEHYSDNEDEPKTELTFEKREPIRGTNKGQPTLRSRRKEQNETAGDTDVIPVLNVKRSNRSPPLEFTPDVEELFSSDFNMSEDTVTEPAWTPGPTKSGRLQTITKESSRVSRRTPRKRDIDSESVSFDDDKSETASKTETIAPSSNQIPAYEHFETRQVHNQVPEISKHSETFLSVSEYPELSRRTPKKQLISEKSTKVSQETEAGSLHKRVIDVDIIGYTNSSDLLNTALIEETKDTLEDPMDTPKKTRQLKITKFVTPIKKQVVEKTYGGERVEKDILKEMFPYEVSTPTGISASCRRPIKGAAGRPLNPKDFKLEERYTTKYVSKYMPAVEVKPANLKRGWTIPMWIKILLFVSVAVFLFLVYQAMETSEVNPFSVFLQGTPELNGN